MLFSGGELLAHTRDEAFNGLWQILTCSIQHRQLRHALDDRCQRCAALPYVVANNHIHMYYCMLPESLSAAQQSVRTRGYEVPIYNVCYKCPRADTECVKGDGDVAVTAEGVIGYGHICMTRKLTGIIRLDKSVDSRVYKCCVRAERQDASDG